MKKTPPADFIAIKDTINSLKTDSLSSSQEIPTQYPASSEENVLQFIPSKHHKMLSLGFLSKHI